jgi:hypothetical protein
MNTYNGKESAADPILATRTQRNIAKLPYRPSTKAHDAKQMPIPTILHSRKANSAPQAPPAQLALQSPHPRSITAQRPPSPKHQYSPSSPSPSLPSLSLSTSSSPHPHPPFSPPLPSRLYPHSHSRHQNDTPSATTRSRSRSRSPPTPMLMTARQRQTKNASGTTTRRGRRIRRRRRWPSRSRSWSGGPGACSGAGGGGSRGLCVVVRVLERVVRWRGQGWGRETGDGLCWNLRKRFIWVDGWVEGGGGWLGWVVVGVEL